MTSSVTPAQADAASFDANTRRLVADLYLPKPLVFWTDLLVSAGVGWAAFVFAAMAPSAPEMIAAALIAAFALYRALSFMHEITHVQRGRLPGFETAWNALVGLPMLLPSTVYVGVHQDHHKISTYGTDDDPEYLPFARGDVSPIVFTLQALLIPALLVVRHVIIVPVELVWPRLHRLLATHASSLSMNPRYKRVVPVAMSRRMRSLNAVMCGIWIGAAALAIGGRLPWRAFAIWYAVSAGLFVVNTLRALAAHHYEGTGNPMTRREQLLDSVDTPGGPLTALWAPVGLRYHALHHYFPGIPYHNLGKAYRRLSDALPEYRKSTSPGLLTTLISLYRNISAQKVATTSPRSASRMS